MKSGESMSFFFFFLHSNDLFCFPCMHQDVYFSGATFAGILLVLYISGNSPNSSKISDVRPEQPPFSARQVYE